MFRAKTVFVIGAGASFEVGLPLGAKLLKQITELTRITFNHNTQISGDYTVLEALKIILAEGRSVSLLNEHIRAGWQLAESAAQAKSIDNVIDSLEDPKVELIGKIGIVRAILRAEASSSYFAQNEDRNGINLQKFENTWYRGLTEMLAEDLRKSQLSEIFQNITIINFNYDRCLEHYLPFSLASRFGIEREQAESIMQSLVVHRPYGVAGSLPWQQRAGYSVVFGEGDSRDIGRVATQIRTFTERIDQNEELQSMKLAIANADRIVFLGFGFHRQNLQLLKQRVQDHTEIFATTLGISEPDKAVIEEEIGTAFQFFGNGQYRVNFADSTCFDFFRNHWRALTALKSDRGSMHHLLPGN
jgi:hypothetical protein